MKPFDAKYTHKDQAGVGFFATAHRQFMVHFTVKPIKPTNYIQIVNSYFARLDFNTGQLIEEIGYLHSSDVRRLLQERDVPFLYNSDDDNDDDGKAITDIENKCTDELTPDKKQYTDTSKNKNNENNKRVSKNSGVNRNEM